MRNNKLIIIILLFIQLKIFPAEKVIKLSTLEWPPYINIKQKNFGFFGEVVKNVLKKIGYETQIDVMPWARALYLAEKGSYDGIIPTYYSKERAEFFLYSDPVYITKIVLFKKKDKRINFNKLSDLNKYTIGIVRGSVTSAEFDSANYLHKEEASNDERNIAKLCHDRVDLINGDLEVIKYLSFHNYKKCYKNIEPLQNSLNVIGISLALNKNTPNAKEIIRKFNIELKNLKDQNEIKKIYVKYNDYKL